MADHTMKLVTIVCESLARDAIATLLRDVGAHGYTLAHVEGSGTKGDRFSEMAELSNIKVDAIVTPAVCTVLMDRLQRDFFPRFAIIAYETDVVVRRSEKF